MQPSNGTPDPVALAVAKAAQDAVHHSTIILFGSRAAGTHRPDSDVDLMLVYPKVPIAEQARAHRAIKDHFQRTPPTLRVDIVPMEIAQFNYCRRAKNHVAGQASRKGITMSSETLDFSSNYEDEYPASWPDVKDRLRATFRNLRAFKVNFRELPNDQETFRFEAQQAIENSFKGWISAANLEYSGVHDLDSIAQSVFRHDKESGTLAAEQLRSLMDHVRTADPTEPEETVNWLTPYGTWYRYHGPAHRMTENEKQEFREEILLAAYTFIKRAQELTGTNDDDLAR